MRLDRPSLFRAAPLVAAALLAMTGSSFASSHREAPFISTSPKVDASDFYMFNSYETGRAGYVTLVANYQPLQDGYDGPNYHAMDANALYEIHIDNVGDAKEHLTFQFRFQNNFTARTVAVGSANVDIAPMQNGVVSVAHDPHLQVNETYTLTLVTGDRRKGTVQAITNATTGSATFDKPADNIGQKTIADYPAYAAAHIYPITIPGCAQPGKVFVGQRQDPFAVNLGVVFDMVDASVPAITTASNYNATQRGTLYYKNVSALELEVPASCLGATTAAPVIGGWTTASLRQTRVLDPTPKSGYQTTDRNGGAWTQVSRLGMPLVNELVIGMKDKDLFNSSKPSGDGQFLTYVSNPSYPKLLETYLGAPGISPTNLPRNDLITTFLTGIVGLNQLATVTPSEMLRLNTSKPAVAFADQNRLGYVGNALAGGQDFAGYPNGRRPKDDVVDITLIAAMGGLCVANGSTDAFGFGAACNPSAVPLGATAFNLNDTVDQAAQPFLAGFPYLNTPVAGTGASAEVTPAPAAAKRGNGSK
ncbi:MAG: DUF4331 domain-containing protein [Betaproteobacteria bacterium]